MKLFVSEGRRCLDSVGSPEIKFDEPNVKAFTLQFRLSLSAMIRIAGCEENFVAVSPGWRATSNPMPLIAPVTRAKYFS